MRIYIKFIHKDDIYAINPSYDLVAGDELIPPRTCGKCGDNLYIPVKLPEGYSFSIPAGEVFRPFPKENLLIAIGDVSELPTLGWPRQKLSAWKEYQERQRLKLFRNVCMVDDNWVEMLIEDASKGFVRHECNV